jgi:hypothetical protein
VLQPSSHLPFAATVQKSLRILPASGSTSTRLCIARLHRGLMLDDLPAAARPKEALEY